MTSLYPSLEKTGESYRLQQISEFKYRLEKERNFRAGLYKKYKRGVNIIDGIDTTLILVSLGLGASGVGLLSTIVAAPLVIGLEAGSIICGLLGAGGKFISRKLQMKAKKHDEIRVLAESKLNTISDHISQALEDDKISNEEFKLILSEVEKYDTMKNAIRCRKKPSIGVSEEEKKELIQRGRDEAMTSARARLLEELKVAKTGT